MLIALALWISLICHTALLGGLLFLTLTFGLQLQFSVM